MLYQLLDQLHGNMWFHQRASETPWLTISVKYQTSRDEQVLVYCVA